MGSVYFILFVYHLVYSVESRTVNKSQSEAWLVLDV